MRQKSRPAHPDSPAPPDRVDETDVLVVGGGPVGLTVANLLAGYGVRAVLVEANAGTSDEPKAISLDDESLRVMQRCGVDAELSEVVLAGSGTRYYGARGQPLFQGTGTPFRTGHAFKSQFAQPELERILHAALRQAPGVQRRFSTRLTDLRDDPGGETVTAALTGPDGRPALVRARYVLGCDGGRSTVRRLRGIGMRGRNFDDVWLVVDTLEDPHVETCGMHHGEPARPHVVVPGRHGRCRYEFLLRPGEGEPGSRPDFELISSLVSRYRTLAPEQVERCINYRFHALVADRWRVGRVLLLGDAAHMMPPFAGQGLNSGIRDAFNLAWKLAAVLHGQAGEAVLDSYERERRPHATSVVRASVRLGRVVMTTSPRLARLRDRVVGAALRTGPGRRYLLGMRFVPRARIPGGTGRGEHRLAGTALQQPLVTDRERGRTVRLDTLLGPGFAVLGVDVGPGAWAALAGSALHALPARHVEVSLDAHGDTRPRGTTGARNTSPASARVRIRDGDGRLRAALRGCGGRFVIVRPDRYIHAVAGPDRLDEAAATLAGLLGHPDPARAPRTPPAPPAPVTHEPTRPKEKPTMAIAELGHTGLWVDDLATMRAFYAETLGLTVTDEDPELGIVFLSSRPSVEHHEFVLQRGRTAPPGARLNHQISWRLDSIESLLEFHHRFREAGVEVQQEVTHGNAFGIYFFDPEGNRNEVYVKIDKDVPQPFRKTLNLDQGVEQIREEADRLLAEDSPAYQPVQ